MGVRQQALDQHADLQQSLLMRGWGKVTIYPVVIGNAGTMTATSDDALQALGVGAAARMTLLKSLAVESVRRTAEIWKPRLTRAAGRPPEAVFSPTPAPDPDAPDTSNCNPPDATTPPGNTAQPASATPAKDTTAPTQSPDEGSSTPSNIQHTAHSQPARDALREAGTTDAPWQVVTRSRARASATRHGPASNSLNLLRQQDQPSKRQRHRFTVLCDDTAPPQATGIADVAVHRRRQPIAVGRMDAQDHEATDNDQDDAPRSTFHVNDAHPPTSMLRSVDVDAHDDTGALQRPCQRGVCAAPQPRRSRRLQVMASDQPTTAAASVAIATVRTRSSRQLSNSSLQPSLKRRAPELPTGQTLDRPGQTVANQDEAPILNPSTDDAHPHARMMPLLGTHMHDDVPQGDPSYNHNDEEVHTATRLRRSKRMRTLATSPTDEAAQPAASATQAQTPKSLRRSKRIDTVGTSHNNGTAAQCTEHTSPTRTPQPVLQSRHSPPRASRKRRPSEPLHMELRRPKARQRTAQTAQPSLQHAHVTESASARHSSKASPHSPSGIPFDRG